MSLVPRGGMSKHQGRDLRDDVLGRKMMRFTSDKISQLPGLLFQ